MMKDAHTPMRSVIPEAGRGGRPLSLVSEPGLYSLILRSRKPEAKAFKRWVTHDVIPSIRKRGLYATPHTVEAMLADPDTAIKLLTSLKEERAKSAALAAKVEQDAPKVLLPMPFLPPKHPSSSGIWQKSLLRTVSRLDRSVSLLTCGNMAISQAGRARTSQDPAQY